MVAVEDAYVLPLGASSVEQAEVASGRLTSAVHSASLPLAPQQAHIGVRIP